MRNDHTIEKKIWFILPVRCLLFAAAFVLGSMITGRNLWEITHWWTILASGINIVTIVVLWRICRQSNTTYREMIRYEKKQGSFFKGFLLIVVMLLIGMGGMYLAGGLCYGKSYAVVMIMMVAPISPYLAVLNIFILPLTTTIAEDGLYLGYGVNSFASKWAAVFIPAFFYALQHSFIPTVFDLRFMIYRFLSFLPLTIWICFRYYRGSSVSVIMTGHWILNIATTIHVAIISFHPEIYEIMC